VTHHPDQKGFTVWFTGLSGSGKSTIAEMLYHEFQARGLRTEILDGDVVRQNLSKGLGFSKEDRDTNILRIGFVADLLTRNGVATICCPISPYKETRDANRALIGNFVEIYVHATLEELAEHRDPKGLYKKARAGEIKEFDLPRPNSGPGDITTGADGALWFIELNGTIDGRVVNGNRVGRITVAGEITELAIPSATGSPTNVAVGPDRNVWYTKGAALGRVTPQGEITEFPLAPNARAVGLTAGSDRQPPARLTNRLWYADGNGNKIGYLSFR